jgi:hypothetical protein
VATPQRQVGIEDLAEAAVKAVERRRASLETDSSLDTPQQNQNQEEKSSSGNRPMQSMEISKEQASEPPFYATLQCVLCLLRSWPGSCAHP